MITQQFVLRLQQLRGRFWFFLKRRVFKVPEAARFPWYAIVVKSILYPGLALTYFASSYSFVKYDIMTDTLTFGNLKFSMGFFYQMNYEALKGKTFRIGQRENGLIVLEEIYPESNLQKLLGVMHGS